MFDEISTVLPPHSTGFERALEQASLWVVQQSEIVDIWNPTTAPPKFLPWLAWSVSVDEWSAAWPDDYKREVIRQSVAIHRLKGTKGAVRRALEVMGFGAEIKEWFENGGASHTFDVEAFADDIFEAGYTIGPDLYDLVVRQIDHVKPARSHFTLKVGERFKAAIYMRNAVRVRMRDEARHEPGLRPYLLTATMHVRNAHRIKAVWPHRHDCQRRSG
jgi:phage tail P2-like protein